MTQNFAGRGAIATVLVAALSMAVFFRYDLLTGFDTTFSDVMDGTIEVAILEHWFNVLRGYEGWSQAIFLHPAQATLGYNDGYLLFGLAYAPLRALGCDPFLAAECVSVAVKLVGFVAAIVFARRALGLPGWAAAAGAAVFTVANGSYMQGGHNQLFTVAFAPALAALAHAAWLAASQRRRGGVLLWGSAAAAVFDAWLLTSFYMAWFFALFAAVLLPLLAALSGAARVRRLLADAWACRAVLAGVAAVLAGGLVPFVLLYGPKASETGMHGFAEMSSYLLAPSDLFNLGGDNLVWARVQRWLAPALAANTEHCTGYTPLLLLLSVVGAVSSLRHRVEQPARLAAALAMATTLCWLLAIQVDGHSLWLLVWTFVPGAGAVRVVARLQLFLQWPVTALASIGLVAAYRSLRYFGQPAAYALTAGLTILIFVEQINLQQIPALDRAAQMAWLRAIPAPPSACRAFVVTDGRAADPRYGEALTKLVGHDVDAMLVAEWLHLPTVNGFASVQPPDWNLLAIDRSDYLARAQDWAARRGVSAGLCGLDLRTDSWNTAPFGS